MSRAFLWAWGKAGIEAAQHTVPCHHGLQAAWVCGRQQPVCLQECCRSTVFVGSLKMKQNLLFSSRFTGFLEAHLSQGVVQLPLPNKHLWDMLLNIRQPMFVGQGLLWNWDSPSELPKIPCSVNRHSSASLYLVWPCLALLRETNLGFISL